MSEEDKRISEEEISPEENEEVTSDEGAESGDGESEPEETIESLKDQLLRLQAEFSNYKRREMEEKADFIKYACSKTLEGLLPGIDHLDLAMKHVPEGTDENWIIGMKASLKTVADALEEAGVKKMELVGTSFDAEKAEALSVEAGEKDVVLKVMSEGYMIHDKVLRLAKVVVGNGEAA